MADLILSDTLKRVAPSPTMAITQKARDLKAQGKDVIALSSGEPDFDTPDHVKDAAIKAIRDGDTNYTAVDGTTALKEAIVNKFKRDNQLDYRTDEVIATSGGKFLIYGALMATLNAGDEVIIPAPYWVSYPDMVRMAGGEPVVLETTGAEGFVPSAEALERMITPRTRWLILNFPNNPSGATITPEKLEKIAEVLRRHPHVWVMTDDIYEHIVYDGQAVTLPTIAGDLKDRTLIVNGASKAYAMTGWRLGFGAGPAALVAAVRKLLGQTTSNPCSITQAAGVAALNGEHDFLKPRNDAFHQRRDKMVAALNDMPGVSCATPEGAFYLFPSCAGALGKSYKGKTLSTDMEFAEALLEAEAVAVVPGTAFGSPGHFRLSYATSDTALDEAAIRMKRFFENLY